MSQEQAQQVSNAEQDDTVTVVSSYGAVQHQSEEEEHIHLPGPSYWPILLAAAMALTMIGLMIDISLAAVGLLLAFIFGIGWAMNWGLERHQQAPVE
ncbi:MAG TPA: cytochrome c oxidase subunit 4 [Ktedonobacterales bacterium]|nr:cytochrome c oxidase subunit 4 [Ktedonobacterales bacterium]